MAHRVHKSKAQSSLPYVPPEKTQQTFGFLKTGSKTDLWTLNCGFSRVKETQGHKAGDESLGPASALVQVDKICQVCLLVAQEGHSFSERFRKITQADLVNSVGLILLPEHTDMPVN